MRGSNYFTPDNRVQIILSKTNIKMLNCDQTDVTMAKSNDKVCLYNKYGFCKYKSQCKYTHIDKLCEKIHCSTVKCDERHPKQCRHNQNCRRR